MKFIFAILAALASFSLEIKSNSIRDINEVIFHAFDVVLREEMRNGNPYTGFPILAPFQKPEVDVSWKFGHLIDLDGALRTVRVDGLDGYHISDVRMSLLTMRFVFDFVWPQVLATGWYNLNGRFAGLIPIFGQGNYRIDPRNFRGSGFASVRFFGPNQNLNITNMDVRLNLQSLNLDIEGILGGGDLGAVINKATQDLIPSLLLNFESEISAYLNAYLLPKINPFLNELTLEDLASLMP